ncbi:MAG: hypothetical protein ACFCUT_04255, partial [Kiloniellaceae bacterium]
MHRLAVAAFAIGAMLAAPVAASLYEAITAPTTNFEQPEGYERNPGGATTTRRNGGRDAFA